MKTWRFYQGLRNDWHWYQLGDEGQIVRACDHGFAELEACMANAEDAGFDRRSFAVHARDSGAAHPA